MEPGAPLVNHGRAWRAGAALVAAAILGACQYLPPLPERPREVFDAPLIRRGHMVTSEQLTQITPGVTRRDDVRALLGSPSHAGTFSDDSWYYISSSTRQRPGRALQVTDQRVVVVRFTPAGAVQDIREMGEADTRNIAFVSRETAVPGNERTWLQALFGNIGRFNPGPGAQQQAPGATQGSGSGR